jgi:restriction system protein
VSDRPPAPHHIRAVDTPSVPDAPRPQIIRGVPEALPVGRTMAVPMPPEALETPRPQIISGARADPSLPEILMQALLTFDRATGDGQLVGAVGNAWFRILALLRRDPSAAYQMHPRKWEEFVAGAYEQDGYEVVLTPHSRDKGRDVIATKKGVGQIRIFDQVKRYAPNRVVSADEVRAFLWVVHAGKASKGFMTTTSTFAPLLLQDDYIAPFIPSLVELRPRDALFEWLDELARR